MISTLWDVNDADAAALMSQFAQEYEQLRTDPVAALGNAQREFVRRGASPAQWAAYSATVAGATAVEDDLGSVSVLDLREGKVEVEQVRLRQT